MVLFTKTLCSIPILLGIQGPHGVFFSTYLLSLSFSFMKPSAFLTFTWRNIRKRTTTEKHTEAVQVRQIKVFNCQCCHERVKESERNKQESKRRRVCWQLLPAFAAMAK